MLIENLMCSSQAVRRRRWVVRRVRPAADTNPLEPCHEPTPTSNGEVEVKLLDRSRAFSHVLPVDIHNTPASVNNKPHLSPGSLTPPLLYTTCEEL